jgi:hypothetical protein
MSFLELGLIVETKVKLNSRRDAEESKQVGESMCQWKRRWVASRMIDCARAWLDKRRRKRAAIERALAEFRMTRGRAPIGAYVLRLEEDEAIVRVMYMTNNRPPDRAWFAVPRTGAAVRELGFEDVAAIESPWR